MSANGGELLEFGGEPAVHLGRWKGEMIGEEDAVPAEQFVSERREAPGATVLTENAVQVPGKLAGDGVDIVDVDPSFSGVVVEGGHGFEF